MTYSTTQLLAGFLLPLLSCTLGLVASANEVLAESGVSSRRHALSQRSLAALEDQLADVDAELQRLSKFSLRGGIGAIGFRSQFHDSSENTEWVRIDFEDEFSIDEIVLVPNLWRDTDKGFKADGFPAQFRIFAGTENDAGGTVIAEYTSEESSLSRVGPVLIPIDDTVIASWVRVEATHLSRREFDRQYLLQLAEIMIFDGQRNVALRRPVKTSSDQPDLAGAWSARFVNDGNLPYLMDSAEGSKSLPYISRVGEQPVFHVDLGDEFELSQIHLHAIDQSDTVPQAYSGDLGIPRHLVVEGATTVDFSDAKLLLDFQRKNVNDSGPIMMWEIPKTLCRYVRLTTAKVDPAGNEDPALNRIGFAEIELYSGGKNVAVGKPAKLESKFRATYRSLASLTDGQNLYGGILPMRQWVGELARRHDLEALRPRIASELTQRYASQSWWLNLMTWLATILVVGIGLVFLLGRNARIQQLSKMRERLAADLHDELGANLHAISLLGDHVKTVAGSPDKLFPLLDRLRALTERTSEATRYCTGMLTAPDAFKNLPDEMRRTSARIMADLEHEITFEGEASLMRLKPKERADLFLFFKECLINISRHSDATRFSTKLTASDDEVCLSICDNGRGLDGSTRDSVPSSLRRRAKLLGAQVTVHCPPEGGTCIDLRLPVRRFPIFG